MKGEARVEVAPDTAWWVKRVYDGPRNRLEEDVFVTEYASLALLARWILRQDGRAIPLEPSELRRLVTEGARAARRAHEGPAAEPAAEIPREIADPLSERPTGPVAPERFGVLQSLLAYLLTACGDDREANITAQELVDRFSIPREQLEEHLSLLNLVNFGGGCYAVYAELRGDAVHVDKELFGDTFRRPPRLTPLEARAIRLALEFVGPMVAAGAHSPLDRVRAKLEETFGAFDLAQTPTLQIGAEEDLVAKLTQAIDEHRLVEIEYLKPEEQEVATRTVEPYSIERRLPFWYVHTWDTERDQAGRIASTGCGARRCCGRRSGRGKVSIPPSSGARAPRASGTRQRSRGGRSRRAPGGWSTAPRSPRRRSAAPNGWSARSSRTAARQSCSSRSSCGRRVAQRARELGAELRPTRAKS